MDMDEEFESLFDALTTDPPCTCYEDIAERTGWTTGKVGTVLARIRRPETAKEQGFTVPHVPRGTGEHLFMVLLENDDRPLTEDETVSVRLGAASTCGHAATMGVNESHALVNSAQYVPAVMARKMRNVAKLLEGAAVMAEEARLHILNGAA